MSVLVYTPYTEKQPAKRIKELPQWANGSKQIALINNLRPAARLYIPSVADALSAVDLDVTIIEASTATDFGTLVNSTKEYKAAIIGVGD